MDNARFPSARTHSYDLSFEISITRDEHYLLRAILSREPEFQISNFGGEQEKSDLFLHIKLISACQCTSKLPNIILKTLTELPASIQYSRANSREIDKDTKNTIDKRNEI